MAASREPDLATLQADVQQLRGDLARMTSDLRGVAVNRYSQASGKIQRQARQIGQRVEEWPFLSALAALATGLLLGVLIYALRGSSKAT
jgi:type VI protein secretion system component VasF